MAKKPAEKTHLSLYWGKDAFSIVEGNGRQPTKTAHIGFATPLATSDNQPLPDDVKFTALLQKVIRDADVTTIKTNLTLSTKDFIFRSFVIPWMPPQEAKNVIDFEATKYIPIPLEDLVYTYQTVTFTDNNQKNMRVIFFAARKDLLSRYTGFIEQAGLQVEHIEPEPVSLLRLLQKYGHITPRQSSAVVLLGRGEGKIFIIEDDMIQFVREFQMPDLMEDPSLTRAKLFNEVRISFSFYTRQNSQGKINTIILLSSTMIPDLDKELSREFSKPAKLLTLGECFRGISDLPEDIGLLNALGNTLRDRATGTGTFELAEKIRTLQKADEAAMLKVKQMMSQAGVAAGCLVFCLCAVFLSNAVKNRQTKLIEALRAKEKTYQVMETKDLEKMKTDLTAKLSSYKDIRLKSNVTSYLHKIPLLMPEQAWIRNLTVTYQTTATTDGKSTSQSVLSFDGYVYLQETNDQFRYVMTMLDGIKKDKDFSQTFTSINLDSMTQETIGTFVVTAFRITCK